FARAMRQHHRAMQQCQFAPNRRWLALLEPSRRIAGQFVVADVASTQSAEAPPQRPDRLQHAVEGLAPTQPIIIGDRAFQLIDRRAFALLAYETRASRDFDQPLFDKAFSIRAHFGTGRLTMNTTVSVIILRPPDSVAPVNRPCSTRPHRAAL